MRTIDDPLAVTLWDGAGSLSPLDRAVRTLAGVAGIPVEEAADWPIDLRDRTLIEARCLTYGPEADLYLTCPHCGEALERAFDLSCLLATYERGQDGEGVRPPTSREVAEAARDGEPARLLLACAQDPEANPEEVEAALERRFPLLRIALDLDCPACDEAFSSRFDPPAYLWGDLERHAQTVLGEVHRIASRYGWSERDILAMSRRRRAAYLERIAA
jgi:hypothetical protein